MRQGWEEKQLGDILQLEYGKPLVDSKRKVDGIYPVYGANGIKDRTDEYYFGKTSIIVGRKGSAGEINLTEDRFWPLDVTYFVTFDHSKYELKFLYYYLTVLNLPSIAKGVKPGINRNEVYSIKVRTPPLPEQQHIVAILDEVFESITRAKDIAERNLRNARELFESSLESLFGNIGDGILVNRLEDICELIVDCEHKTAPTQQEGFPSIRTPNVGRGELLLDSVNRVSYATYKLWTNRAEPLPGDLIFAREAPAGNVAIIPPGLKVCLGQRTVLIRVKGNILTSDFLMWLLLTKTMQLRLMDNSRGATVVHVNMKDIRELKIDLIPSIQEQYLIFKKLKSIASEIKKLESIYQQKLAALEELRMSVLQKAFSGEL